MNVKVPIMDLQNQEDADLKYLANYIYEYVFLHYTEKQWGMTPEEVGGAAMARIPFYVSRDDRYFQNRYQGIPTHGYTKIFERMLDNPNIHLMLNTNYHDIIKCDMEKHGFLFSNTAFTGKVIYTAPLDELFNYCYGNLPYRTLDFVFETYDQEYYQEICTVNYPNNYDFTRIGEYKYFLDTQSKNTVVSYEYPEAFVLGKNERYYPIINEENKRLYEKYLEEAKKNEKVTFLGRLGDYKYYDMDQAVARALNLAKTFCSTNC